MEEEEEEGQQKSSCALEKLKRLVLDVGFPSGDPVSPALEQRLEQLLPRLLHPPDHPPYAAMIQEAIGQLNEEEGSAKESISSFIKNKYNDLPWAHDGMLDHHLSILCKSSYLVQTEEGRYLLSSGPIEKSDAPTSPSVDTSYNSFSSSSSSSGSDYRGEYSSEHSSEVLGKRKLLPKKQKEAQSRKRTRQSGESVFAGRTKSSVIRLDRPSEEDDLLISSDERESNEVESEEYRSTKQPCGGTTDTDNEFHEQENQKKKEARESVLKGQLNRETLVARRGKGRHRKNVPLEVSEEEKFLKIEDKQETKSLDKQNKASEQLSIPDEISEKQNRNVDYLNEVHAEETKLLQLLPESATGEDLPEREDEDEEAYKQIELLVRHTEATTKKQERSDIQKCKLGVETKEVTPKQFPVPEKGSGKRRGRPRKQLVFGEMNLIPGEMMAIKDQNLQEEVPKKRRGRPPKTEKQKVPNDVSKKESKLQDPNEEGKELKKKPVGKNAVPGRRPGRPPKNDLSRELQTVQDQFQMIKLQEIREKTMDDENDPEKKTAD